jgi:hypothetical protein
VRWAVHVGAVNDRFVVGREANIRLNRIVVLREIDQPFSLEIADFDLLGCCLWQPGERDQLRAEQMNPWAVAGRSPARGTAGRRDGQSPARSIRLGARLELGRRNCPEFRRIHSLKRPNKGHRLASRRVELSKEQATRSTIGILPLLQCGKQIERGWKLRVGLIQFSEWRRI